MSDPKDGNPTAKVEQGGGVTRAEASGPGAAAGIGKLDTFVQGLTAAGISSDGQLHVTAPLDPVKVDEVLQTIATFSEEMQATMQALLQIARQKFEAANAQGVALLQMKSTVDEIWAEGAAAKVKGSKAWEKVGKGLLEAALSLGLHGINALLAAPGLLPK